MGLFDFTGNEASLYLHIPFCAGACGYCDFYSLDITGAPETGALLDPYADALERDLERLPEHVLIPTVDIGGGNPSVLGGPRIGRLLSAIRRTALKHPAEITVEANPESVNSAFLRACLDNDVTRISIGVQTFHGPARSAAGRTGGDPGRGLALLQEHFSSGNRGFSIDLMTGLPLQGREVLARDIAQALSYRPDHISLYALTLEGEARRGLLETALPDPDEADELWIRGRDGLRAAGYGQYEASNFASAPDKRSRHNIRYWRMESWIGLGAAASSTLIDEDAGTGRRFTFPPDAAAYIQGAPPEQEVIDRASLLKESILMGFRYQEGPSQTLFRRRFGADIHSFIPRTLEAWQEKGLLYAEKPALTPGGMLFLNRFLRGAFAELDSSPGNDSLKRLHEAHKS
ncbi:MAG: coproporphyrinogen III oxidase family protein [Spirochaetaceae bacterium]|jgi:oxygen-independent coproporphyrinogen-3 oxidase|nr:coproporphyrinogen III oxidase family protein [Spirochaetaceae bacterium]